MKRYVKKWEDDDQLKPSRRLEKDKINKHKKSIYDLVEDEDEDNWYVDNDYSDEYTDNDGDVVPQGKS